MQDVPTVEVQVSLFDPLEDSHGAIVDRWAAPAPVDVYGWASAGSLSDNQPIEGDRRPAIFDYQVFMPKAAGGPRAHWELPDGTFEQVGHAADYSNGPWWKDAGAVAWLTRVEG